MKHQLGYRLLLPSGDSAGYGAVVGTWPASPSVSVVGPLNGGESASFFIDLTIPADASPGASDVTGVTVTSAWDSTVGAEAQLTTTATAST